MKKINPTPSIEALKKELAELGSALVMADEPNAGQVQEALRLFQTWVGQAKALLGEGAAKELEAQARLLKEGLLAGRPLAQAVERTLKLLLEASRKMEPPLVSKVIDLEKEHGPKLEKSSHSADIFVITPEDLPGYQDFTAEVPEYLQAIETALLDASQGRAWEVLQVLRPFHTLKGVCGFMNLPAFSKLAHSAETLLEPYKKGQGRPTEGQIDILLRVVDIFRAQLNLIQSGITTGQFERRDVRPLLNEIASVLGQASVSAPEAAGPAVEIHSVERHDSAIRIGIEKMDALLEAVGELAICQSQVLEGVQASETSSHLLSETSRLGKISRLLQDLVLSLRMVPVQPLFLRMSRLVRDLSQKMGKPLQLELKGGETELDKGVVEELAEPLVHLLRNAVDHGLEPAEQRLKSGKSAEGRITLTASHESGDFMIRVEDDGAGLNLERLAEKGKKMGLISKDASALPDQLTELIFTPGFSTAAQISEVSGRGVGLDAVRRKAQSLKGSVTVDSRPGQGTIFTLRIPLTIALMDGILVRVGRDRYVIPSYYVRQFMEYDKVQTHQIGAGPVWIRFRDENIPLVDLAEWMGIQPDFQGRPVLIHLEVGGRQAGLLVDEVLGKRQVVVKTLGETLKNARGVAGGAILGDGRVGLILDVDAFLREKPAVSAASIGG